MRTTLLSLFSAAVFAADGQRCVTCGSSGGIGSSAVLGIGSSSSVSTLGGAAGGAMRTKRLRSIGIGSASSSLGGSTQCCRDNKNDISDLQNQLTKVENKFSQ